MQSFIPPPLSEQAPLALLYHENSKITEATKTYLAEGIAEFTTNVDELRRMATSFKTYPGADRVDLTPFLSQPFPPVALDELLIRRRSVRGFRAQPLPLSKVAALLERAAGVTGELEHPDHREIRQLVRAHPSGGALYPIETYVVALSVDGLSTGIYHFHAPQHCLERVRAGTFHRELERHLWIGDQVLDASAVVVLTGRWNLPLRKYRERGYRVLLLDAGHLMENLLLTATALCFGACPIAGFHDDRLAEIISVDPHEEPVLYCALLGYPDIPPTSP
jgi:SagB-type dehydrogenase family enzyme